MYVVDESAIEFKYFSMENCNLKWLFLGKINIVYDAPTLLARGDMYKCVIL